MDTRQRNALGLAGFLGVMGTTHFAVPGVFDTMIPEQLPGRPRTWTLGSGVAELAIAGLVAVPATRRHGASAAVALFVGVLPGNVKMTLDARRSDSRAYYVGTLLRLPFQVPMIAWALKVRRAG